MQKQTVRQEEGSSRAKQATEEFLSQHFPQKPRLNTEEAAQVIGLSKQTLEIWRCYGIGPRYLKIGRRVFYRPEDLEEYANSNVVETVDTLAAG